MKKVLALVLAAAMSLGMASVAFAAEDEIYVPEDQAIISGNTITFQKDDKVLFVDLTKAYKMDDKKVDITSGKEAVGTIEPGTTLYFKVYGGKFTKDPGASYYFDSGVAKMFTNVSDLKDFRVSYSIDDGKNMIASAKFVKVDCKEAVTGGTKTGKALFVALETKNNFIMESQTVSMTLKVGAKNNATVLDDNSTAAYYNSAIEVPFNHEFMYEEIDVPNGLQTINDKAAVLSFDDDADDVTLFFDEDVEVWGNMKGQKDVFVHLETENDALEEKYPDAELRLFEGDKDTFRRDVKVTMPYESAVEKPYVYEVDAKGNLTKLYGGSNADKTANATNVKYDDVSGAFTFETKTLGNYVISETELKSSTTTDVPATGDEPTPDEPNPGTGANDFVGLAVALAVVSVAGIAVAKRK